MSLKVLEGGVGRLNWRERREKRANDGGGLFDGGDVGSRADLCSGEEASATKLDREEGLISGRIVERPTNETSERAELEGVRVVVNRREGERVASAKTVKQFGEGEAGFE